MAMGTDDLLTRLDDVVDAADTLGLYARMDGLLSRLDADWDERAHPREPGGKETGGQFTSGAGGTNNGGATLKKTATRAFTGKQVETKTHLSKQESGKIGEGIIIQFLKQFDGMADAHPLNSHLSNFPVDLIGDHELIEVKTGLVSNSPSAQKWRATIGQPGKAETEALKKMTAEQKAEWNAAKMQAIMDRKNAILEEFRNKLGRDVKARTMTVIIDPDTRTADVFRYEGFHLHIRWNNDAARAAYVGTFNY